MAEWHNDEDFIRAKTSGSTGIPKEIKLEKRFVRESAERTNNFFGIGEGSRFHSCVAADYIGGKMMAVRADISKSQFSCETPSNEPLKGLGKEERIDLLAVVASQMHFIVENKSHLGEIRNIIVGGSSIHPELRKKIAKSGLNAFETYGMTETASHIALRKIEAEEKPFVLLPGISIEIDQEECLIVHFNSGTTVRTNDIVEIASEKEFFIKGRRDNVIISGGKKINPIELERRISKFISEEFFLKGEPDEKWGQKLVLLIEGERRKSEEKRLMVNLKGELEKWELPKEILYVNQLPRTGNGKIQRN